jgi:hypothetical protein
MKKPSTTLTPTLWTSCRSLITAFALSALFILIGYSDAMSQCASVAADNTHGNWATLTAPTCAQQGPVYGQGAGSYIYYASSALTGCYMDFYLASNGTSLGCANSGYYAGGDVGPYTNIHDTWGTSLAPAATGYVKVTTTQAGAWNGSSAVLYYKYSTPGTPTASSMPTTACINTATTYTVNAVGSTTTGTPATTAYIWSVTGVTASYSASTASPTQNITFTSAGTATVTVYATNNGQCNSGTVSASVTVYAASVAGTITQNPASGGGVCRGNNVSYTLSGQTGSINSWYYQWNTTSGAYTTWSSSANPYNWTSSLNPPSILYVIAQVQNGVCPAVNTSPVNITVYNQQTLSLTGGSASPSLCKSTILGTNTVYTFGGGATSASITSGGVPSGMTGAVSGSTFVISGTPTVSGSFPYTVTTSGTGSCSPQSLSGTITVYATQTMSLTGGSANPSFCQSTTLSPNTVYTFGGGATSASITSGSLPSGMTGAVSGSTFVISGTPTANGSFPYTVTSSGLGSCSPVSLSGTITVYALPTPTFTVVPSSPICTYVNATYTTQSGQTSYVWGGFGTAGVDYNIISGSLSSTSNTVTLQWISTGTKTVTVSYSSTNGCAAAAAASATTVVNASPTPTISTSGTGAGGCTGLSLTYTTQSGQSSYVWTIPGTAGVDYTLISGGSSTDNTLVLSYITAGPKTVTVNYNNSSGCTGVMPASNTIVFYSSPTSAALASVIDPCNGGYAAQVTVAGGTSPYTFELTPPGSYYTQPSPAEVDGQGATAVTVSNITDANGCPPASVTGTNPITFGSRGITPGGDSADCVVAAGATQMFFDHRAQLMAKITAGGTSLGSTGVITTVDGSGPLAFGPTHLQHYLQRHFRIVPTTSAAATVCLYISDAEANALNSISGSSDVHVAPEYYGTFPASTASNTAFASGSRIMQYDGSSETPSAHSTETVITSITATHNPIVDGFTYSGVWQMCFGVSGFSGFYVYSASSISGDNNALPVTLVSFTAQAVDNKFIELDWITASEINNAGFQLERSTDGTNYQAIGWVDGHGTSTVQNEYKYSDLTAVPGIVYYYHLKQIDVDGHYAYSNIASASLIGGKGFTVEGLYPNPANSQVSIGVISNIGTSATVTITDMLGRSVLVQDWALSIGYNTNPFDVSNIANGTYVVTITSGDVRSSKRLVITR